MRLVIALLIACVIGFFEPAHATYVDYTITNSFYFTAVDEEFILPLAYMVGISAFQDTLYISDISIGTGGFYIASINNAGGLITPYSWDLFYSPITTDGIWCWGSSQWDNDPQQLTGINLYGGSEMTVDLSDLPQITGIANLYGNLCVAAGNNFYRIYPDLPPVPPGAPSNNWIFQWTMPALVNTIAMGDEYVYGMYGNRLYTMDYSGSLLHTQILDQAYTDFCIAGNGKMYAIGWEPGLELGGGRIYELSPIPEPTILLTGLVLLLIRRK